MMSAPRICVYKCVFRCFYLFQISFNKNTTFKELFVTNNMVLLKKSIAELVKRRDYKTLNELLRINENVNMLDRLLNEDIPQSEKSFTRCDV